ncbi:hypothetical protein YTPLAS18_32430 [Nitrospira sp.]|nr:hypothetical protein YTPLAS18_32430 [Nitrospira sp.]
MRRGGHELVVFVTASSRKEANAIATRLVRQRLVACATVVGVVESIYRWQGKIERSKESMLMMKTTSERYLAVERQVREMHSYDVPEIIAVPIERGSSDYLSWIQSETSK